MTESAFQAYGQMDDSYPKELNGSSDHFGAEYLKQRNSAGSRSSEEIRKAVEQCLLSSSNTLDVSRKNINHLTKEIYKLPSIKYVHLEGNVISTIPEGLFQKLPHLVWLDLRYNKIKALPPGIGYHRRLKTLLLERNPIKELPAELGNLTSLTALNLRDCPLEFPPKDVVQKGLKSILCFLRDSGKGKLLCMEPDASVETPPVEKLNLSELLQSSLDLSGEWPNEEEKLRFQKLKEVMVTDEEFFADERVGATHAFTEAGKTHRKKGQRYPEAAPPCRPVQAKRSEACRSAAAEEVEEEHAVFEQGKRKEGIKWSALQVEIREGLVFTKYGAPRQPGRDLPNFLPATNSMNSQSRSLREKELEQRVKQHTQMMKAREEKSKGTPQVEKKRARQGTETWEAEDLQTKLAVPKGGHPLQEYRLTAFTGAFPLDPPRG